MTDLFFVYCGKTEETEVVREVLPPKLLLSYHYFRNKDLGEVIDDLGYTPEILLDSGAYSAWSKGKNIALVDYMDYLRRNEKWISEYISLDVIGDSRLSRWYWRIMREYGFRPVPVFHWGEDEEDLKWYIEQGATRIALGGTVPVYPKEKVAEWAKAITAKYPHVSFHLLGSSSDIIMDSGVSSCDSSTWMMAAVYGKPRSIPGKTRASKIQRAKHNMRELIQKFGG